MIAPALGALGLVVAFTLVVLNFEIVSGIPGAINFWLVLPTPVLFVVGIVVGLVLKRRDPGAYAELTQSIPVIKEEQINS
jgi:hypothetical protein